MQQVFWSLRHLGPPHVLDTDKTQKEGIVFWAEPKSMVFELCWVKLIKNPRWGRGRPVFLLKLENAINFLSFGAYTGPTHPMVAAQRLFTLLQKCDMPNRVPEGRHHQLGMSHFSSNVWQPSSATSMPVKLGYVLETQR